MELLSGANLDITTMAAAVKKLPEYTQTMTKLGQHVAIAQQCMNAFSKLGLLNLSLVEQIISTGFDEDGNEVSWHTFPPGLLGVTIHAL
jgi:Sec1 family